LGAKPISLARIVIRSVYGYARLLTRLGASVNTATGKAHLILSRQPRLGKFPVPPPRSRKIRLHPASEACPQRNPQRRFAGRMQYSAANKKTGGRLRDRREPNPCQKHASPKAERIPAESRWDFFALNTVEEAAGHTESLFSCSVFYCLHCH
jgi:hypothetical protein